MTIWRFIRTFVSATLGLGLALLVLVIPGLAEVSLPAGDLSVASAHLDPPGSPPIGVTVQVIGVATDTDQDDDVDDNAELEIDFVLTHAGHPPVAAGADILISDNYDWDVFGGLGPGGIVGGIQPVVPPVVLYTHDECTPMNRIDISVDLGEDDFPTADDLGNGAMAFLAPGAQILQTAAGTDGTGRVEIEVTTVALAGHACDLPAGTQPPTDQEQNLFNAKLGRLQANAGSMPVGVGDAITSLTQTITKQFNCPEESAVTMVTVNITTAHVRWDPNLAEPNSAGTYDWNVSSAVAEGKKTITAQNWVMLDPAVTAADEANPPLGPLADEGLFYHELLHGQLQINAMDAEAWQEKACNCHFDHTDADMEHAQIFSAVVGYSTNRAPPGITVKVVEPPAQQADETGSFKIDLGPTDKNQWTFNVLEPNGGSNVDVSLDQQGELKNLTVTVENGRFKVNGVLIEKTEPGKFLIRIDPPSEWIFGGIENLLVVLPYAVGGTVELLASGADAPAAADGSGASFPYAAIAGGAAAAALALVTGGWYARRRRARQG